MLQVSGVEQGKHFYSAELQLQGLQAGYELFLTQLDIMIQIVRPVSVISFIKRKNILAKHIIPEKSLNILREVRRAHSFQERLGRQVCMLNQFGTLPERLRFHHYLYRLGNDRHDLIIIDNPFVDARLGDNNLIKANRIDYFLSSISN